MYAFLLALLVSVPGTWFWDPSPTATGYEFCWSYNNEAWSLAQCVDVGPLLSFLPSIELDAVWAIEANPGSILFYQVIAYNGAGYDSVGQTFAQIPPDWTCP